MSEKATLRCPLCGGRFIPKIESRRLENGNFEIDISSESHQPREAELLAHLISWWQWKAEGEPPPWNSRMMDTPPPHGWGSHHDNYRSYFKWLGGSRYSFSIQISDSPDGDTWWRGEIKVSRGAVEIIEQETVRR